MCNMDDLSSEDVETTTFLFCRFSSSVVLEDVEVNVEDDVMGCGGV